MAAGSIVLAVAMADSFVQHLRGRAPRPSAEARDEIKLIE